MLDVDLNATPDSIFQISGGYLTVNTVDPLKKGTYHLSYTGVVASAFTTYETDTQLIAVIIRDDCEISTMSHTALSGTTYDVCTSGSVNIASSVFSLD